MHDIYVLYCTVVHCLVLYPTLFAHFAVSSVVGSRNDSFPGYQLTGGGAIRKSVTVLFMCAF